MHRPSARSPLVNGVKTVLVTDGQAPSNVLPSGVSGCTFGSRASGGLSLKRFISEMQAETKVSKGSGRKSVASGRWEVHSGQCECGGAPPRPRWASLSCPSLLPALAEAPLYSLTAPSLGVLFLDTYIYLYRKEIYMCIHIYTYICVYMH